MLHNLPSLADYILSSKNQLPLEVWARNVSLATTAWTDIVTYSFLMSQEGVILRVGVDLENPQAFANVTFRLALGPIGGALTPIDDGMTGFMPRSECLVRPIEISPVFVKDQMTVHLQAQSAQNPAVSGITHVAWGRISGIRWNKLNAERWAQLIGEDPAKYGGDLCPRPR